MNKKEIITEMVSRLKDYNLHEKGFFFRCYADQMFTYSHSGINVSVEITFICDKFETLLDIMEVSDLLNLKKTEYLSVTFYTDTQEEIVYNSRA